MMEATVSGTLCELCLQLLDNIETFKDKFDAYRPFHEDRASLQRPLNSGCALCNALPYDRASFHHDEVSFCKREGYTQLHFFTYGDKTNPHMFGGRFALHRAEGDEALFSAGRKAALQTYTGSHDVLNVASEWMVRCVQGHEQCVSNQLPEQYPTRLLDIQEEDLVRLVEPAHGGLEGPYATLSHSWGREHFKVLTSQTMPEFRSGIKLEDIPSTFRDAIHVARRLKIPYLWIDCYCILQSGSTRNEDQRHEIATMGEIYSNAILNIGAGAASSPMDGCFVERETIPPVQIKVASKACGADQLYLIFDDEQMNKDYQDFAGPSNNAMFRRAWCMQERFLCPRMLHFCKSGLFWECDTVKAASDALPVTCFPEARIWCHVPPFSTNWRRDYTWQLVQYIEWLQIVEGYSAMELSRPAEDKFAACGGVAKLMAERIGDEYVAGFLRRDLIATLPWLRADRSILFGDAADSSTPAARRSETWRASFTWTNEYRDIC